MCFALYIRLMLANWAARCNVNARIIDKNSHRIQRGHSDGLQCRTLEILDSFGLAARVLEESNPLSEKRFWVQIPMNIDVRSMGL